MRSALDNLTEKTMRKVLFFLALLAMTGCENTDRRGDDDYSRGGMEYQDYSSFDYDEDYSSFRTYDNDTRENPRNNRQTNSGQQETVNRGSQWRNENPTASDKAQEMRQRDEKGRPVRYSEFDDEDLNQKEP